TGAVGAGLPAAVAVVAGRDVDAATLFDPLDRAVHGPEELRQRAVLRTPRGHAKHPPALLGIEIGRQPQIKRPARVAVADRQAVAAGLDLAVDRDDRERDVLLGP